MGVAMKERDLVKSILAYLGSLPNTYAFRVEQRPGMSRGVSDILAVQDGRFLAIEVKVPGNQTTPLQDRFLRLVSNAGGESLVVFSLSQLERYFADRR
jgi:hypothetical protein